MTSVSQETDTSGGNHMVPLQLLHSQWRNEAGMAQNSGRGALIAPNTPPSTAHLYTQERSGQDNQPISWKQPVLSSQNL